MPDENMWRFLDPFEARYLRTDRTAEQIRVMPADGTITVTAGAWIDVDSAAARVILGFAPPFPGGCVIAIVPDEVE